MDVYGLWWCNKKERRRGRSEQGKAWLEEVPFCQGPFVVTRSADDV